MKSSFFEFNTAISGLFSARAGLDTVSHNIANASTPGFSRQYIEQRAAAPLTLNTGRGMFGTGSEVYGVGQYRSTYLDKKYWAEVPVLGEYSMKNAQMSVVEKTFNELSATGFSAQVDLFFDRIQELTRSAGDSTYRTNLTELGTALTTYTKNTYETLLKQQRDINSEVKTTVDIINSIGQQIKSLNVQIVNYEIDGSKANDLRDQRMRLVDELSKYVNVEAKEIEKNQAYAAGLYPEPEQRSKSSKEFVLTINGNDFIKGSDIYLLECRQRVAPDPANPGGVISTPKNPNDAYGLYDIYFAGTSNMLNVHHPNFSGELKGLFDARDGNNADYFSTNPTNITLTGTTLTFDISGSTKLDLDPNGGMLRVYDGNSGRYKEYAYRSYSVSGGTVSLEMADSTLTAGQFQLGRFTIGETSAYKGIPYYMERLNTLVRTFATAINEGKYMNGTAISGVIGHVNGYDANGDNLQTLFFTYVDENGNEAIFDSAYNINKMNAANFTLNSALAKDPSLLAAATSDTIGISNNEVILSFLNIKSDKSLFKEGTLKDYINGMTGELGIQVSQAISFEASYTDVTVSINNQRMSVSGVNLDDEMVAMVRYQQQYQAAAKLVNIINEIYDRTINNLGA